jgi:hypothetical protein
MEQLNSTNHTTAAAAVCPESDWVQQSCADKACVDKACVHLVCAEHATVKPGAPRDLLRAALDKGRALLRVYFHSRKVRAAANALAQALAESRESSSWPGDRLPVGEEMSAQVEKLTRRLKLETEAQTRLAALFKSVDLGRSAAAV